jgi:hypothetical protein
MNEIMAFFSMGNMTMKNFLIILPWLLNSTSLLGAYCLSNHKVVFGRYIGVCSSMGWGLYGFLIEEYSFVFANMIFFYIYSSAVYKFNKKRDEYKATFEEQESKIEKLHKELDKKRAQMEREYQSKQKTLNKIKENIRKQLIDLDKITDMKDPLLIEDKRVRKD